VALSQLLLLVDKAISKVVFDEAKAHERDTLMKHPVSSEQAELHWRAQSALVTTNIIRSPIRAMVLPGKLAVRGSRFRSYDEQTTKPEASHRIARGT